LSEATVIAIDGPSASGKGSTARALAERLGFLHVDTGAMYRALTWHCQQRGLVPTDLTVKALPDPDAVVRECAAWPVKLIEVEHHLRVELAGRLLGDELRTDAVAKKVALVSHVPAVREWMLEFQRGCARLGDLVMEGRDIGTRIFPKTPFKFYLEADAEVRAQRGTNAGHGGAVSERDQIDADLNVPAADALVIDTSHLTVPHAVEIIVTELRRRAPEVFR
jgi:cytidylate kinase